MKSVIDKIKGRAIYAFLVLMVIFFTIINPNFLTVKNLLNVAKQVSIFGIREIGTPPQIMYAYPAKIV